VFQSKDDDEKYIAGQCYFCYDLRAAEFLALDDLSVSYHVKTEGVVPSFLLTLRDMKLERRTSNIMSVPDLDGAFFVLNYTEVFEILTPTTVFVDTPRGVRVEGTFGPPQPYASIDGPSRVFLAHIGTRK
jgi:hypothetical protein